MRLFVAVAVGPAGAAAAPSHLTLRFLGEVADDRLPAIAGRLREVASAHAPFDLEVTGVGAFPSMRAPRVVWAGVGRGAPEIGRLADDVRRALAGEGEARPEARFVPHVTLFRVRTEADRRVAADLLHGRRAAPPGFEVHVAELLLVESVLRSGGADHRTVERFPLATGGGA